MGTYGETEWMPAIFVGKRRCYEGGMKEKDKTAAVKAAVEQLKALPGQDAEALELLLDYSRKQYKAVKAMRGALADARAYALMRPCSCEGGGKCDRCRLVTEICKVLG